jgi:hypothetical protein
MAGHRYWKGLTPVESCRPLFKEYDILPVFSLYVLECSKFVRKNPEKFVRRTAPTNNSQLKLHVKLITLNISSQNPLQMAARIFNKLPTALKEIDDDLIFVP